MGSTPSVMNRDLEESQYVDILVRPEMFTHFFDKYVTFNILGKKVNKNENEITIEANRTKVGQIVLREQAAKQLIDRLLDRGPGFFKQSFDIDKLNNMNDFYKKTNKISEAIWKSNLDRKYDAVPKDSNFFKSIEMKFDKLFNQNYFLLTLDNGNIIRLELWSKKPTRYQRHDKFGDKNNNNIRHYNKYLSVNQSSIFLLSFINQYGPENPYTSKIINPFL